MILDALFAIPAYLIGLVLDLLETAQPYPDAVYDAFALASSYIARLDFIIDTALLGDLIAWYFLMLGAWFVIYSLGIFVFLYRVFKVF